MRDDTTVTRPQRAVEWVQNKGNGHHAAQNHLPLGSREFAEIETLSQSRHLVNTKALPINWEQSVPLNQKYILEIRTSYGTERRLAPHVALSLAYQDVFGNIITRPLTDSSLTSRGAQLFISSQTVICARLGMLSYAVRCFAVLKSID
jgi:hypothetical protein